MSKGIVSRPDRPMSCALFLQRLGLLESRPNQSMKVDLTNLRNNKTPIHYPIQERFDIEKLRNKTEPFPWTEKDIAYHSNEVQEK